MRDKTTITTNNLLIMIIFLKNINFVKINGACITTDYEVEIYNGLPSNNPPLTFHCASKDTELGNHTLSVNHNYLWTFCENVFRNTLFFCTFHWGAKNRSFEVFNSKWSSKECGGGLCFWLPKTDGFYFKSYTSDLVKKYDWQ